MYQCIGVSDLWCTTCGPCFDQFYLCPNPCQIVRLNVFLCIVATRLKSLYLTSIMDVNQQIIDFLSERMPALKGIYLFGSRAEGRARPDSDIDIAFLVEWGHSPTAMERWEWAVELSGLLNIEAVDLVGLQEASTDFRFVIVSTGQHIYCSDRTYCDTFDMIAYSMYQRLELERREIVKKVKKRGRIYG